MEGIEEEIRKYIDNFLKIIGSFMKENKKEVIKTLEESKDPNHFFSIFPDSAGEIIFKGLSKTLTKESEDLVQYLKDACTKLINGYINSEKEKLLRTKQSDTLKQINMIDQDMNLLKPFYDPLQENKKDDSKYGRLYKLATSFLNKKRKGLLQQINDDERIKESLYKKNTFKIMDKVADKFIELKEKVEKDIKNENKDKNKKSSKRKKPASEGNETDKEEGKDGVEESKQSGKAKKKKREIEENIEKSN